MRSVVFMIGLLGGCAQADERVGPPPIVLVSMDTLRADRLGAYGNADGLTPNFDRFAEEAIVFEHAYSQATNTPLSHMSLFTSRYPSEVQFGRGFNTTMPTIAQVLSVYGYQTAAFVGGGGMRPEMGLDRGFELYESAVDFASLWHTGPMALQWIDGLDRTKPWFVLVHGYDAHTPYIKPSPYGLAFVDRSHDGPGLNAIGSSTERAIDGRLYADTQELEQLYQLELRPRSPESRARLLEMARASGVEPIELAEADLAQIRGAYDGGVAYGDAMFGVLMAQLESRKVLDEAIVVVIADHGEQLGEDGIFNHCCGTGDAEIRVPLMVRLPGGAQGGRRVSGVVELLDVTPTLLELAGAELPAGLAGKSFTSALLPQEEGAPPFEGKPVAFTQAGFHLVALSARGQGDAHLTWWGIGADTPYVADVIEAARLDGPGFVRGEGTSDADAARLRTELVAWMRDVEYLQTGQPQVSAELKATMKKHGYFDLQEKR
ncbi:MAG: sulfatase [Myxococcota bacterium]